MDENLRQLVRQLRKETCPQKVLDEVERRRSRGTRFPGFFRYALGGSIAGLAILCMVAFWQKPVGTEPQQTAARAVGTTPEGKRIAREAEGALGYIGAVLLDASAYSGSVILKETVQPLQNSLQTAKKKITDHI